MEKILFTQNLNAAEATTATSSYLDFKGLPTISESELTSNEASDYKFILNGVEYPVNFLQNGDTRFKIAYREGNKDSIMFEIMHETGLANFRLRKDKSFEVLDNNILELVLTTHELVKTTILNFGNIIVKVTLDGEVVNAEVIE